MRLRLKTLLSELDFPEGYQWYSLRRGGATHAFRSSNDLSRICFVGRWNSIKTARIYLTDALATANGNPPGVACHTAPSPPRKASASWIRV